MKPRLGTHRWGTRWVTALTVGMVITGFAAASAIAAPTLGMKARALAASHGLRLPAQFNSPAIAQYGPPEATLTTKPAAVKIGSVTYELQLIIDKIAGNGPPTIEAHLERDDPSGLQSHDYVFGPVSGIKFTFTKDAYSAAVKATAATSPSAFVGSYTAVQQSAQMCTLQNGTTSAIFGSKGTIDWSNFQLATGTSPFFGTILKGPVKASMTYNPGCRQRIPQDQFTCSGSETIQTTRLPDVLFAAANDYGDPAGLEFGFAAPPGTRKLNTIHVILSVVPKATAILPKPTISSTGATAIVKTTGVQFMSGEATFTSTKAPKVLKGGHCKDFEGKKHTYSQATYKGTLTPASGGLSVNFDTGAAPITKQAAEMFMLTYTS